MAKASPKLIARQYGALPFRVGADGHVEVMLITSRDTRRWIIPKGWPIPNLKPRQVASREAREEAGLHGSIVGKTPLGTYQYEKRVEDEPPIDCQVIVFALRVARQRRTWKEKSQRRTQWFPADQAASLVQESNLSVIIAGFSETSLAAALTRRKGLNSPLSGGAKSLKRVFQGVPLHDPDAKGADLVSSRRPS